MYGIHSATRNYPAFAAARSQMAPRRALQSPGVLASIALLFEAFEFEFIVLFVCGLVWYTISMLVSAGPPLARLLHCRLLDRSLAPPCSLQVHKGPGFRPIE